MSREPTELAEWFVENVEGNPTLLAEEFIRATANNDRLRDELLTVLIVQDTLASDD